MPGPEPAGRGAALPAARCAAAGSAGAPGSGAPSSAHAANTARASFSGARSSAVRARRMSVPQPDSAASRSAAAYLQPPLPQAQPGSAAGCAPSPVPPAGGGEAKGGSAGSSCANSSDRAAAGPASNAANSIGFSLSKPRTRPVRPSSARRIGSTSEQPPACADSSACSADLCPCGEPEAIHSAFHSPGAAVN
ncbi:hypothetical protein [Paenibacillus yonginensis]|uniref:hypothetical protein n=1 Tax=Paenibacillus yonginensis TaxID=1462996 RepID=UPI0014724174|nr:hypothetical protein [Paenibacillus yonginensis]